MFVYQNVPKYVPGSHLQKDSSIFPHSVTIPLLSQHSATLARYFVVVVPKKPKE